MIQMMSSSVRGHPSVGQCRRSVSIEQQVPASYWLMLLDGRRGEDGVVGCQQKVASCYPTSSSSSRLVFSAPQDSHGYGSIRVY
jgi:hypothetical protein